MDNNSYRDFVDVLQDNIEVISNNDSLMKVALFGDLLCIDNPQFWEKLERKVMSKMDRLPKSHIIGYLKHFSNQVEGSDRFYDNIEQILTPAFNELKLSEIVELMQG